MITEPSVEPMSFPEKEAVGRLQKLGWKLLAIRRDDEGLRASFAMPEGEATLHCIHATVQSAGGPAFFRLDTGILEKTLRTWHAWQVVAGDVEIDDPESVSRYRETYQAAAGEEGTSLGLGIWNPVGHLPSEAAWSHALERFASYAKKLTSSTRREFFESLYQSNIVRKRRAFLAPVIGMVALAAFTLASIAMLLGGLALVEEGLSTTGLAGTFLFGLPTILVIVLALRSRKGQKGLRGWDTVFGTLAASGFGYPKRGVVEDEFDLAVVRSSREGDVPCKAEVRRETVLMKSSRLPLRVQFELHEVSWFKSMRQECKIVPGRYAIMRMEGDAQWLGKLAKGPRERRWPGARSWTFADGEFDRVMKALEGGDLDARMPYR